MNDQLFETKAPWIPKPSRGKLLIRPLLTTLTLLVACAAPDDSAGLDAAQPDIRLLVGSLDFGDVQVGVDAPASYQITIYNQGTATLHIDGFDFDHDYSPFTITGHSEPQVAPDASGWVELAFDPQHDSSWTTSLLIHSDDPDTPQATVELLGEGLAPVIEVSPELWEPNTGLVGCTHQQGVVVRNTGRADLHVLALDLASATNELSATVMDDGNGSAEGLATVGPGDEIEVATLEYTPSDAATDSGYLTISSDDPTQPEVVVAMAGDGEIGETGTDSWVQTDGSLADMVIAVDKSQSMESELEQLPEVLSTFIAQIIEQGTDLHLAVAVADDGCVRASPIWFDVDTSQEIVEEAIDHILDPSASTASNTERAFMLFEAFISETPSGGCNEGFLREGAQLHLMGISDDEEQSVNSWFYYFELLSDHLDDPDDLGFHALGGPSPKGCNTISPYNNMLEAVQHTDGVFQSICEDDWSPGFDEIAARMMPQRVSFGLSATPVPDSILVKIDSVFSTHWQHDATTDAVVFDEGWLPDIGDLIEIEYTLQPECE
jgi:hypothetical protein